MTTSLRSITIPQQGTQQKQLEKKAQKLFQKDREEQALAVCSITGIAITLSIPALPGRALEYKNPLAMPENFIPMCALPYKELLAFPPSILAGLVLASFKHFTLIDCPHTGAVQNLLLQSVHPSHLIAALRLAMNLAELRPQTIQRLCKFTIQPKDETERQSSTTQAVLKTYLEDCSAILNPKAVDKEEKKQSEELEKIYSKQGERKSMQQAKAILAARKTLANRQQELIKSARALVKELATSAILSVRLLEILKHLVRGDALLTVEASVKDRIVTALSKYESIRAQDLVKILMDKDLHHTLDTLFDDSEEKPEEQENILETGNIQDVVTETLQTLAPSTNKVLSLKEKLFLLKKGVQ